MSKQDPIAFASSLRQTLNERAPEIERARGVPAPLAQEMAAGGLFQLLTPSWLGGLELDPLKAMTALEETAKGDMSCAWVAMISSTTAMGAAWMDRAGAKDIFSTPNLILAGVAAPFGTGKVEGDTLHAGGTWGWGSGSNRADFFAGGCLIQEGEKTAHRMVFFPQDKIKRLDDWFVMGLSGSSSNTIEVPPCHVPHHHCFSLRTPPNCDGALYKMPFFGMLSCGIAACALGNGAGMLEEVLALINEKTPQGTKSTLAQKAYVQIDFTKITARLNEASDHFHYALAQVWDKAQQGNLTLEDRARLRLASMTATYQAAGVATEMHHLAGGSSIWASSPLQRRLRDSQIATQHRMVSATNYQLIGKVLLGLVDEKSPLTATL